MRIYLSIFYVVFFASCSNKETEIENHIEHLRKLELKRNYSNYLNGDSTFVDYTINRLLQNKSDTVHITDRNHLKKLRTKICRNDYVKIQDQLSNGRDCEINIQKERVSINEINVQFESLDSIRIISIDNKVPFGNFYGKKSFNRIKSIEIKVGRSIMNYTTKDLPNLLEPFFCEFDSFIRKIEAYENREFIYVYIYGGNAANTYFAKLVFTDNKFVTSIICDYIPLSSFGCFSPSFSGF